MSDGFFPEERLRFEGLKYFQLVDDLMQRLHGACEKRDQAGNRNLHYDQYALLLLFYFFNPTITSLRALRHATMLEKVQKVCGVKITSLTSLSEAANVFDPKLLEPIIAELAARTMKSPGNVPETHRRVFQELVAVDGTLLKALPRMACAVARRTASSCQSPCGVRCCARCSG